MLQVINIDGTFSNIRCKSFSQSISLRVSQERKNEKSISRKKEWKKINIAKQNESLKIKKTCFLESGGRVVTRARPFQLPWDT